MQKVFKLLDRIVETNHSVVIHGESGLPNGSARNATDGFRYLVDEGCLAVAGAYSELLGKLAADIAAQISELDETAATQPTG